MFNFSGIRSILIEIAAGKSCLGQLIEPMPRPAHTSFRSRKACVCTTGKIQDSNYGFTMSAFDDDPTVHKPVATKLDVDSPEISILRCQHDGFNQGFISAIPAFHVC